MDRLSRNANQAQNLFELASGGDNKDNHENRGVDGAVGTRPEMSGKRLFGPTVEVHANLVNGRGRSTLMSEARGAVFLERIPLPRLLVERGGVAGQAGEKPADIKVIARTDNRPLRPTLEALLLDEVDKL
jgi:hypothetical protein